MCSRALAELRFNALLKAGSVEAASESKVELISALASELKQRSLMHNMHPSDVWRLIGFELDDQAVWNLLGTERKQ